jgi:hypothetical protein
MAAMPMEQTAVAVVAAMARNEAAANRGAAADSAVATVVVATVAAVATAEEPAAVATVGHMARATAATMSTELRRIGAAAERHHQNYTVH